MHSIKLENTVRHIEIHKNEDLLESETSQIPIDGSFQIVKERRKRDRHGVRALFLEILYVSNRAERKGL